MMQIIVTGGTGLIGKPLTAVLAKNGHDISVLSRNPGAYQFPPGVQGVQWDAQTPDGWGRLVDGADAIINLAGENIAGKGAIPGRWNEERKQRIRASRRNAGKALVAAIEQAKVKPKLLFQASGIDYYPPGAELQSENFAPGNTFLSEVVAVDWEPSTAPVETMGVRRIVGRLGPLLSLDGGPLPISILQFKMFVGGRLGNGRQWLSWIHEDDAVGAIQYLVENRSASGVYNLVAPNPVQNKQFSSILGTVMGRPSLIPAPSFALKLGLGEISTLVLDGRRVSGQKLLDTGYQFKFEQLKPALKDLLNKS